MKRRGFIKAFAAACVVPVVAARAIASHKKKPKLFIDNTCQNTIKSWKDYDHVNFKFDGESSWYIDPKDAPISKMIRTSEVRFDSDWGQVNLTQ